MSLNFLQEKKEADFRYGLVRVRENSESIAFYGGEENEMQLLLQRFRSAFENLTVWMIWFLLLFPFYIFCHITIICFFFDNSEFSHTLNISPLFTYRILHHIFLYEVVRSLMV